MFVAIGFFKLRTKSKLFKFLRLSKRIEKQALSAQGNIGVQLSGGSLSKFFVITQWKSAEEMKAFTFSGAHMEAIKLANELADEIRLLYYETDKAPEMEQAKQLLLTDERVRIIC